MNLITVSRRKRDSSGIPDPRRLAPVSWTYSPLFRRNGPPISHGCLVTATFDGETPSRILFRPARWLQGVKVASGGESERAVLTLEVSTTEAKWRELMAIVEERGKEIAELKQALAAKECRRQVSSRTLGTSFACVPVALIPLTVYSVVDRILYHVSAFFLTRCRQCSPRSTGPMHSDCHLP